MSKEIKLIPELRFPEFESDGEWNKRLLGEIGEFIGGGTPSTSDSEYWDGDIQWYTPTEVKSGILNPSLRTITREGLQNSSAKLLPIGAILITTRATIGDAAIVNKECTTNQGFQSLVVNESEHNHFWYHWIVYHKYELIRRSSGSTFKEIGKTEIKLVPTISPKKDEQQKIASCLSSLDELIAAHNDKLQALKDHKKGLLQNLFPQEGETVPRVRFPEFEGDGEWDSDSLVNIAQFRRGSFPQPYGLPEWYDDEDGMPFIQVYDVDDNFRLKPSTKRKISELAAEQSVFIEKGTVIITIQGSIGRVAITQYDSYIDRTLLIFQEFYDEIDKTFFAYTLFLLFEIEKQKAPGGIIKTITKQVLSDFTIKIPSLEEQKKIASCLSAVDELINAQSGKIEELNQHKRGLMQGLFPKIES